MRFSLMPSRKYLIVMRGHDASLLPPPVRLGSPLANAAFAVYRFSVAFDVPT
jgi:hypothetical protein